MFRSLCLCLIIGALLAPGAFAAIAPGPDVPTYSRDVAPIFNTKCVSCHRPGQAAPMSLRTYTEVRPWVRSIQRNVAERVMPPWHAVAAAGKFLNDRSLSDEQVETIVRWARSGAPEGDPADLPPAPTFPGSGWRLGEPDAIVEFPEVEVPAGGPDQFHNLVGKLMLPEDRWVKAIEILPGNPKVVHHVITIQIKGFKEPNPTDGWLGAWAAGAQPMVFPDGTGRLIEKGANLVADMHYHPAETPEKDITRVGLHFADESEIEKALINVWVINESFKIPPGAANHEVKASYTFLQSGKIYSFIPHMHYRGKDFTYTATFPDGRQELLLAVDNYDFGWQTVYTLEEPIAIPEGTRIDCVAHYDNSENNLDNPDPTRTVTFGDESYDEMMIGFLDWVPDAGRFPETKDQVKRRLLTRLSTRHPQEVFAIYRDEPSTATPLHLAAEGDGVVYLSVNNALTPCRIHDVRWDGTHFKAKVDVPNFKVLDLRGSVDRDAGTIESELIVSDEHQVPLKGQLATTVLNAPATPTGGE